jgi:hypothetical protein
MISRTATGLSVGTPARVGTSAFATVSGLEVAGFAVELVVTPEGTLAADAVAGLAVLIVPIAGFGLDATTDVGFGGAALVGFAVAFDVAGLTVELGPKFVFEPAGTAETDLASELVGEAGFGVCAGLATEAPVAP